MPICDPRTGELIEEADVDALAGALIGVRDSIARLRLFENEVCAALVVAAPIAGGGAKTRRVRGQKRRVKIVVADDGWDQSALKTLWCHTLVSLADKYLRIERIGVNKIEYNKLAAESGPPEFEKFKEDLRAANLGPRGNPVVTVEE